MEKDEHLLLVTSPTEWTTTTHYDPNDGGVLVHCKTPAGEDVYVPLKSLVALVEKGLAKNMRTQMGRVH